MTIQSKPTLDDGIPLTQVWAMLSRNWRLILLTIGVFLTGGVALITVQAPTYEASVQFVIGQVGQAGLFEDPGSLTSRMIAVYGENSPGRKLHDVPYLKSAQLRKGTQNTIEVVAIAASPASAKEFLNTTYQDVATRHKKIFKDNVAAISLSLKTLDDKQESLLATNTEASRLLDAKGEKDPTQIALLTIERGQNDRTLVDLNGRRPTIVANLTPPRTMPTELLGEIYASDTPVSPKKLLLLIGAIVLGIVFGIVLAICRDTIRSYRAQMRQ